jgi:uncharacterized protein YbjT (DUF2867 family)
MNIAASARRIFVTGATGYLGSRLIPLLLERGHHVTALARPKSVPKVPPGCTIVVGNPLDSHTFAGQLQGSDSLVQMVGVPKPAPWKGSQFRAIDRPSAMASIRAAAAANVQHFVYVSVARPAPIMRDYIAVRAECEAAIAAAGLIATILRPWYILGPGHWWPVALQPIYGLLERLPTTRDAAMRLGLVSLKDMLSALLWSIEHPPTTIRVIEVPQIRSIGRDAPDLPHVREE